MKYERLTYHDVLSKGLRVMDAAGISLAQEDDKPIIVLNMTTSGNIERAVRGEKVGSLIAS